MTPWYSSSNAAAAGATATRPVANTACGRRRATLRSRRSLGRNLRSWLQLDSTALHASRSSNDRDRQNLRAGGDGDQVRRAPSGSPAAPGSVTATWQKACNRSEASHARAVPGASGARSACRRCRRRLMHTRLVGHDTSLNTVPGSTTCVVQRGCAAAGSKLAEARPSMSRARHSERAWQATASCSLPSGSARRQCGWAEAGLVLLQTPPPGFALFSSSSPPATATHSVEEEHEIASRPNGKRDVRVVGAASGRERINLPEAPITPQKETDGHETSIRPSPGPSEPW